ncbi:DUF2812 domain-containing protein [Paenibacillus sp. GCM10023250]|uniref:DUF2812 domain-containing protein n=1 Tax=Paenibacillus sp. GCM10023250 TaxID=3252648 RepID=UPI003611BF24
MAVETVKKTRLWMSWQYEQEEEWVNAMSAQGLHLRRAGIVRSAFERDPSVRYTYRLDYQPGLGKGEKLAAYLELYRDAGWEHAGTFAGIWYYFRRPWQPGESPRLYTDRDSLAAHYKRIRGVMAAMLPVNAVLLCVNGANLLPRIGGHLWTVAVPVLAIYAAIFALLGTGIVKMNRKIKAIES